MHRPQGQFADERAASRDILYFTAVCGTFVGWSRNRQNYSWLLAYSLHASHPLVKDTRSSQQGLISMWTMATPSAYSRPSVHLLLHFCSRMSSHINLLAPCLLTEIWFLHCLGKCENCSCSGFASLNKASVCEGAPVPSAIVLLNLAGSARGL